MPYYEDLHSFYKSKEWQEFRKVIIAERLNDNMQTICEHCGKPIIKPYDIILHHKTELTLDNVNNASITLNPDNIQLVHFKCHNTIHNRYGSYTRHIYLVYGCPLSGKSTYVKERAMQHDLIIDIDRIYQCISNNPLYVKSGRLYDNMEAVKNLLLDNVKYGYGKWVNAFIIGGYAYVRERERLAEELGAELIFMDCTKEEALLRLECCNDGRDKKEWKKYIQQWFDRYIP